MSEGNINPILSKASDKHLIPAVIISPELESENRRDRDSLLTVHYTTSTKKDRTQTHSPRRVEHIEFQSEMETTSTKSLLSSSLKRSRVRPSESENEDEDDLEINESTSSKRLLAKTDILSDSHKYSSLSASKKSKTFFDRYYPFPQSHGIHHDIFTHSKYFSPITRKSLLLLLLGILGVLLFLVVFIYSNNYVWIPSTTYQNSPSSQETAIPSYRLTFLGDSLINRPVHEFDLVGRLQRRFSTTNLNITDHSVEGNTIARVRKTVLQDMPPNSADMMIMLWDTDVSDYDESTMSAAQVAEKRAKYLDDLFYVVNVTKAAGVQHIAISGPNLLGEGPYFNLFLASYIVNKKTMLEEYVAMNEAAAKALGVDYIDMRQVFLQELPDYWLLSLYYLTFDGEHPNYRGAGLIAEQFAQQISRWTGAPLS